MTENVTSPDAGFEGAAAAVANDDAYEVFSARGFTHTPLWQVGEVTQQVVDLYQRGLIEAELAEDALEALVVVDADGSRWALGGTSRRWYRKLPGGKWHLARPPARPEELAEPATASTTAALRLLGVDPDTVTDDVHPEAVGQPDSVSDLLDQIVDGYGD